MIDTGTFITGVGVLVSLDLAVLAISVSNARRIGEDTEARDKADKALMIARESTAETEA